MRENVTKNVTKKSSAFAEPDKEAFQLKVGDQDAVC
jgi:hypothetical protein